MHNSGSWLTENASKFKSENEHFTVSRLNADQIAALRLLCFGRETVQKINKHFEPFLCAADFFKDTEAER